MALSGNRALERQRCSTQMGIGAATAQDAALRQRVAALTKTGAATPGRWF
jgi:hypothetical protein